MRLKKETESERLHRQSKVLATHVYDVCKKEQFTAICVLSACGPHDDPDEPHEGRPMDVVLFGCKYAMRASVRKLLTVDERIRELFREELAEVDALRL